MVSYERDGRIGVITLDSPHSTNTIGREFARQLDEAVGAAWRDKPEGVLLRSAKADFVVGANLFSVLEATDAAEVFAAASELHSSLRKLETGGIPVAAALGGTALGGGLELALACHYRVAADKPAARFGLPEVTLGLMPGAGGTQRLPRLLGIQPALALLLEGKRMGPAAALQAGLVHEVVAPGQEEEAARRWLGRAGRAGATQPWDRPDYQIPGGAVQSPGGLQTFAVGNAMLAQKTHNTVEAAQLLISAVYEGVQVGIDTGLRIEARKFTQAVLSPTAKRMVKTLFFGVGAASRLAARPAQVPSKAFTRVGVLGAGLMGAGIAMVQAQRGLNTVLLDTSMDRATAGKQYTADRVNQLVARGRLGEGEAAAVLGRISPSADFGELAGCDLVIEAVFEDSAVKADVTRRAVASAGDGVLFASNTSTLPITSLAAASPRPDKFIGLHFFSPVEKMPLVEVILGRQTSAETLAHALDYVASLGKTPIVVNDSRGFYTSRVFASYVHEGMAMLAEGVAPAAVEHAGRLAGMPVGPLALADEVAIDLFHKVLRQTQAELGSSFSVGPGDTVIVKMVEGLGRAGRKTGAGFYEYAQDGAKRLWPGLAEHWPVRTGLPVDTMVRRLINVQVCEAVRCRAEEVVLTDRDADVGAILGWGFAPHLGGPMAYVESVGPAAFAAECAQLEKAYGSRFRFEAAPARHPQS